MGDEPRLAELVGGLSLATDLAAGLGLETALRTCVLAVEIGRELGAGGSELKDIYYTALLRFIGCTAFAHETARVGAGDDLGLLRALTPADGASVANVLGYAIKGTRASTVARMMLDPTLPKKPAAAHCDLAVKLAARLGMSERVMLSLGQIYERFDGKGNPGRLKGAQIELPARVMHVAFRVEVQRSLEGQGVVPGVIAKRAGGEIDPEVAAAFSRRSVELLEAVGAPSVWDTFLAAEPQPFERLTGARLGEVALAFAHFVDVKSPFTLGHSTGVARLAEAAARALGLDDSERERLRVAALLHDLGRVSVPNGIWDKPGPLNPAEWERVRMHSYHTERILAQSPLFKPYAQLAAMDHERTDGSGYHRGVAGAAISRSARLLAAADAYQAMTEARAHRAALTPEAAAEALVADARSGRLDREAVEAVLTAAGHRAAARIRGGWPAALSDREVEVLCLLARGLSNKQIGAELSISAKTAQHHVQHILEKTGVSTRAAAAVLAVENDLLK